MIKMATGLHEQAALLKRFTLKPKTNSQLDRTLSLLANVFSLQIDSHRNGVGVTISMT